MKTDVSVQNRYKMILISQNLLVVLITRVLKKQKNKNKIK